MQDKVQFTFLDKHVIVMGLGRFGGGLGVTRYLLNQGARVTVSDRANEQELVEPLAQLGDYPKLNIILGEHAPELLNDADVLVVNPAVPRPWEHPFIQAASERGVRITTEIEIAYRLLDPNRIIAITGSAGKSTTSAMVHHTLKHCGVDAVLGGNIGGSLLDRLDDVAENTGVVLELSSAMIYWLWGQGEKRDLPPPRVTCVSSYSPNHLDWHGDESHYRASKQQLLKVLGKSNITVLQAALQDWAALTQGKAQVVTDADAVQGCAVPGNHNAMNAACAIACISSAYPELDRTKLIEAVKTFPGLPHRLHRCHEHDGVVYFDDSKSTTPGATLLAVSAMRDLCRLDQIHLIVGGYDKGSDLSPIAQLAPKLAGLYTIGSTGAAIAKAVIRNAMECETLDAAMNQIAERAKPDDIVLLSPGCASWDQFVNYEKRGEQFLQLAMRKQNANPC